MIQILIVAPQEIVYTKETYYINKGNIRNMTCRCLVSFDRIRPEKRKDGLIYEL